MAVKLHPRNRRKPRVSARKAEDAASLDQAGLCKGCKMFCKLRFPGHGDELQKGEAPIPQKCVLSAGSQLRGIAGQERSLAATRLDTKPHADRSRHQVSSAFGVYFCGCELYPGPAAHVCLKGSDTANTSNHLESFPVPEMPYACC